MLGFPFFAGKWIIKGGHPGIVGAAVHATLLNRRIPRKQKTQKQCRSCGGWGWRILCVAGLSLVGVSFGRSYFASHGGPFLCRVRLVDHPRMSACIKLRCCSVFWLTVCVHCACKRHYSAGKCAAHAFFSAAAFRSQKGANLVRTWCAPSALCWLPWNTPVLLRGNY